jgi:hypothetical protein
MCYEEIHFETANIAAYHRTGGCVARRIAEDRSPLGRVLAIASSEGWSPMAVPSGNGGTLASREQRSSDYTADFC